MSKLVARTVPISAVDEPTLLRLLAIYERYYGAAVEERFRADFAKKDAVILLLDAARRTVHGFSTLKHVTVEVDGTSHRGIYSGDTVIEREYWGQGALGRAFLAYLFLQKLKRPFSPLWWFLISKGYKTYLLLANNFPEHWPRHERATPPARRALMDGFATEMFGACYDPARGVVEFPESLGHLKPGVADASDDLVKENPRIAFFAQKNPRWHAGTELVCLGGMTLLLPLKYAIKALTRGRTRRSRAGVPAMAARTLDAPRSAP